MSKPTVDEIVRAIEMCSFDGEPVTIDPSHADLLIASWRDRGEALKLARPFIEADANEAMRARCEAIARATHETEHCKYTAICIADAIAALKDKPSS